MSAPDVAFVLANIAVIVEPKDTPNPADPTLCKVNFPQVPPKSGTYVPSQSWGRSRGERGRLYPY